MTAASSLAFPGSRTLAGWWRQLAPLQPQSLWVGHLFLHRVEALVASVCSRPLDPLNRFVLQAVAAEQARSGTGQSAAQGFVRHLNERLHLGEAFLQQLLRVLAAEGLAEAATTDTWALTAQGRAALERGAYPRASQERRVFHFVEPGEGGNRSDPVPHFLYLNGHVGVPWSAGTDWSFDVGVLHSCVGQVSAWKQQHGFPEDVREVLQLSTAAAATAWQRVIVDRPERLPVLLALAGSPDGDSQLLGFAVRQEGWTLQANRPVFTVRQDWHAPFPDLREPPSAAACRQAWRLWCQPRGFPGEEVEGCDVRPEGLNLSVVVPPSLLERLRAARSDALKGEAWLLIGDGSLRAALLLEIAARP